MLEVADYRETCSVDDGRYHARILVSWCGTWCHAFMCKETAAVKGLHRVQQQYVVQQYSTTTTVDCRRAWSVMQKIHRALFRLAPTGVMHYSTTAAVCMYVRKISWPKCVECRVSNVEGSTMVPGAGHASYRARCQCRRLHPRAQTNTSNMSYITPGVRHCMTVTVPTLTHTRYYWYLSVTTNCIFVDELKPETAVSFLGQTSQIRSDLSP